MDRGNEEVRIAVREAYGARALAVLNGNPDACCGPSCCDDGTVTTGGPFYAPAEIEGLPETVVSFGCGNPTAIAGLRPGEVVLDLGSGAGLDCFLAARQVGPEGRVIGLDMTDTMLTLAEQNKAALGLANVEFRKGAIESIPLPDESVDVIISNCVINLSPDKPAVFAGSNRVLRPGGRLHISDIVLLRELSPAEQQDLELWAGCVSGALGIEAYESHLRAAGFTDISIVLAGSGETETPAPWRSAHINARRPGGDADGAPGAKPATQRTAAVPVPAASGAPCCGPGAPEGSRCC